jgi:hypothetical protein
MVPPKTVFAAYIDSRRWKEVYGLKWSGQSVQTNELQAPSPEAAEYVRRMHSDIRSWYDNAEDKAQRILTLDGVFIAFISGSLFAKRGDVEELTANFGPETWALLGVMAVCVTLSVICAELCLWSRHYLPMTLHRRLREAQIDIDDWRTYRPEFLWFFQHVGYLHESQLAIRLAQVDPRFEVEALAANSHALARNVTQKHWLVNFGFALAGGALLAFLGAALSYLLRAA